MMRTFMERAIAGEFENLDIAIDDAVEEWHTREHDPEVIGDSLHLYLGMTWQEYAEWVQHASNIVKIIERRRS